MKNRLYGVVLSWGVMCIAGCAVNRPAKPVTAAPSTNPSLDARIVSVISILGEGTLAGDTYTIRRPRNDIGVVNDLGDIPVEAGIESVFYFFLCPCGKTSVVGQFCLLDYELNDVIDELRAGQFRVVSVAPMFLAERPRVLILRFQGEGHGDKVPQTVRSALKWVGEERRKRGS